MIDQAHADNLIAQFTYMHLYWNHLYNSCIVQQHELYKQNGHAHRGYNTNSIMPAD